MKLTEILKSLQTGPKSVKPFTKQMYEEWDTMSHPSTNKTVYTLFVYGLANYLRSKKRDTLMAALKHAKLNPEEAKLKRAQKLQIKEDPDKFPKNGRLVDIDPNILKCRSDLAKAAVATVFYVRYHPVQGAKILTSILKGDYRGDIATTIAAIESGQIIPTERCDEYDNYYKLYINALVELSHLLRDRTYSKTASLIDFDMYLHRMKNMKRVYNTLYPYEPAVNRYLKTYVAPCDVETERAAFKNRFEVDPERVMNTIYSTIKSVAPKLTHGLSENVEYDYCILPLQYVQDMKVGWITYSGKVYNIITYKDALFDVLAFGDTYDGPLNSVYNMRWSERLALVDFIGKIEVSTAFGKDINMVARKYLHVNWMENRVCHAKTITLFKSRKD